MNSTSISSTFTSDSQTNRNLNIDLLRILACLYVVGMHSFTPWINSKVSDAIYYICTMAIPVFIMITGYYIMHKENLTRQYCNKKILSILRLSVIWCSLTYIIYLIEIIRDNKFNLLTDNLLVYIFNNMILSPDYSYMHIGQLWYMGMLISLYILIPHIAKKSDAKKKNVLIITGTICVAQKLCEIIINVVVNQQLPWIMTEHIWVFYLMLGYYIQDITDYISKKLTLKKHIIIAVIWTILSYIYRFNSAKLYITEEYTVLMKNADYYYDLIEIIQIIIIFSLLLRLQIKESGSLAKVIKFLAPLTTGIFLLHNFVLYYFIETEYFTQTFTIRAIAFVTAITFSLIMSLLINKLPIKLRDALTKI